MTKPRDAVTRAWIKLIRAQHAALSHVEAALKQAGFPPLAWYDVLLELTREGEGALRPFELERRLLLPQYGLSRLLDRIEAAGLIEKRRCSDDRRGHFVAITEDGRALQRRMWPVYAAAIETAIGAKLSETEAETLADLLGRL